MDSSRRPDGPGSLLSLSISADLRAWQRLGLSLDDVGDIQIGMTRLTFVDPSNDQEPGIADWTVASDRMERVSIDGLVTRLVEGGQSSGPGPAHELGATLIDHVVVMTPSLDRTCTAITEVTSAPLKRIREVGRGVRQGFHRLGEVIVEVVERPDIPAETPARFWGLVLIVDDLLAAAERLGPSVIGLVKPAVQPGRRIATVRNDAGLALPVALMSA